MTNQLCFYQRLAISLAIVFILVLGVFLSASAYLQRQIEREAEQSLHKDLAQHLAKHNPLLNKGVYDYEALKDLFHTLMILGPNFEFYYLDPKGKILTYSPELGELSKQAVDINPIKQFIENSAHLPILGDDPMQTNSSKIFSASPLYSNKELQGYLYIIIGGQIHDSILASLKRSTVVRQSSLFVGVSVLFLFVALLILFKSLTKPIKMLSEDMDKVRACDFDKATSESIKKPWKRDCVNEVERLGCAFNDMLTHIDAQFDKLQNIDKQRRLLLADLSHDLRTPLANLQGYIETLDLQNDSLSAGDRKRFVDISLKNARNLRKLIDQIFELAYLESGHVNTDDEHFSARELLHDIASKFEIKAANKHISLSVHCASSDVYLYTDIAKLERIITNLLENAIRHTPDKGNITLSIDSLEDTCFISVSDSGIGIPGDEVDNIFTPRYQASNQQKDGQIHAGLGLAICAELTKVLNGNLSVNSKPYQGTKFTLRMKHKFEPNEK